MPIKKSKNSHYSTDVSTPGKSKQVELEPSVSYVTDCWDSWDDYWANKFTEFEKYYDRWMGKPPKRDEDWQAQFHKRLTWQAEKTLVARFHSALFPISAPIETEATETPNELQRIVAKSLVAHWFKIGRVSKEFLSGMRSAGIYGTGLFEDDWYVRKEQITEKVEKQIPDYRPMVDVNGAKITDEDGNIKTDQIGTKTISAEQSKLKVVEDRYRVRKANIFAWRVHPNKIDDDDDLPAIKQEFVTYDDLLERQAEAEKYGFTKFDNMDLVEQDKTAVKEEDIKRLQKEGDYIDIKNPRIELLHYWGLYSEKEGDKKKPMWITVANRKYKLWARDNPFWHKKPALFHIVWTEDERPSYYGIGIAQIGADAEDRANVTVNIRIDERKKNLRGGGVYNVLDKKIKKTDLQKNIPGLWRGASDVNNIKPDMPIPKSTLDDYREEEVSVNDHREITGATSSLLPTENLKGQADTLGGMQQNLSQSMSRLKPDLAMMETMGVRRIADRALLLSRQFMTQNEAIEIIATQDQMKQLNIGKIYTMTPKELMGSVKFFCTGLSESIDKLQNIDKLIKYAEMTAKVPAMQQITNYQAIAKRIALWLGFEDVSEFVNMTPVVPGMPPGMPPQNVSAPAGGGMVPNIPTSLPAPTPNVPMVRPPMPGMPQGMPQGQGQGLPPQLLQLIIQQMMARQMMQQRPPQGGMG